MRWGRGVTNVILWIYVYGYPLSSCLHVFCLRRRYAALFVFLSACYPAHHPPALSVFHLLHFLLSRPTHAFYIPLNSFLCSLFSTAISPLFAIFSGSCYVANLVHHLLLIEIENQDGSGGRVFLPFDVLPTGYEEAT